MTRFAAFLLAVALTLCGTAPPSRAQLKNDQNFLVLKVRFSDMTAFRFADADIATMFDSVAHHWGASISYGIITPKFAIQPEIDLTKNTATYITGDTITNDEVGTLLQDVVAAAPAGLTWTNLAGLVILFADNRSGAALNCNPKNPDGSIDSAARRGFFRGRTPPGVTFTLPDGSTTSMPVSIVGENPCTNDAGVVWGRWAHEIGHALQADSALPDPPHPSNYISKFEQMDAEYPGQSGVFEKQDSMAFRGWLPTGKYIDVSPPTGAQATLWAEENPPAGQPVAQAIKAKLLGTATYYLVSVRRRLNGDDIASNTKLVAPTDCTVAATPNGIPDCGVLIERVVEGGDPTLCDDAPPPATPADCTLPRWVQVIGRDGDGDKQGSALWHAGDTFDPSTYGDARLAGDGIVIQVLEKPDQDHYQVRVRYDRPKAGQPDVGLERWLQPPGNTYETTDIWIDSPLNGYAAAANVADPAAYRYGAWSDLEGSTVPVGNGDDPAVGQDNRIYARVRNFGTGAASNVTVSFDITDPPGLGINGANGFKTIGQVGPADFPGLASIPAGGTVDVFVTWKPDFPLTPQQLVDGQFFFHTCVRVRLSHVAGETFFANQDGDGQQENILYFDSTAAGGPPGSPGDALQSAIHIRNDSNTAKKTFLIGYRQIGLPPGWTVKINGGQPIVSLGPAEQRDIPVAVQQTASEAVGSRHAIKVFASTQETLNAKGDDPHDESRILGGVTVEVAVLRKPVVKCTARRGVIRGTLAGTDDRDRGLRVAVVPVQRDGAGFELIPSERRGSQAPGGTRLRLKSRPIVGGVENGRFAIKSRTHGSGVCLFAGSKYTTSGASAVFKM